MAAAAAEVAAVAKVARATRAAARARAARASRCITHCMWGSNKENQGHRQCTLFGSTQEDCPHQPKCVFLTQYFKEDRE